MLVRKLPERLFIVVERAEDFGDDQFDGRPGYDEVTFKVLDHGHAGANADAAARREEVRRGRSDRLGHSLVLRTRRLREYGWL